MNVDPNNLSYEEQVKLERFMIKIQAKESYSNFSAATYTCFNKCINDFYSKILSNREVECVSSCLDDFISQSQRVTKRFGEENIKMQQAANNQ
ncbi:hypothetical protein CONCODRAFT_16412 [Conidiobolus coronatus NRRL 28638]|uniref:Mitochondrial import inner membrane translocase subunit n=1 Tax=Conidiobolus coronatus (strain ATCC 28846 / CBS 209.66 / NRRL 28638) TaxID=796925 RepID=A0A137PAW9_CONC2|nr:hypothetical protein CONCODRAFT_16412 [Conidiobolus coronatus NRRL 28638]|eukprot:KXN72167.1 hypothetical protein CONCODRAFT_16412 [Conidiobolus coronatus NRRL 28638]